VVALPGTASRVEWWDDLHWNLVPFAAVSNGGKVAEGFVDIYDTFGTTVPAGQASSRATTSFAADIADAVMSLACDLDPGLPTVVCGQAWAARSPRFWWRTWPPTRR
jgi:hypothetical protein